jgi:hypothetical protein
LYPKKIIYAGIIVVVVLLIGTSVFFLQPFLQPEQPSEPKAAIIDQLSSSFLTDTSRDVNQTFVDTARTLLYTHFPEVDYYSDNATVENYRNLASMGYKLIIWRAHSAVDESDGYVAISTSENNETSDYPQYANGELTLCEITNDPKFYFAITPKFITDVMTGSFEDTVIILMSCNGLGSGYTKTAEALKDKGAVAVISWNAWVGTNDNDNAIALLLDYLLNKNDTISQAVANIPVESYPSGPCTLEYYPASAAEYYIPNYNEKTATVDAVAASLLNPRQIETGCSYVNPKIKADVPRWASALTAWKPSGTTGSEAVLP